MLPDAAKRRVFSLCIIVIFVYIYFFAINYVQDMKIPKDLKTFFNKNLCFENHTMFEKPWHSLFGKRSNFEKLYLESACCR